MTIEANSRSQTPPKSGRPLYKCPLILSFQKPVIQNENQLQNLIIKTSLCKHISLELVKTKNYPANKKYVEQSSGLTQFPYIQLGFFAEKDFFCKLILSTFQTEGI